MPASMKIKQTQVLTTAMMQSLHLLSLPLQELERFVRENDIEIAVLTIPKAGAVEVAEKLVSYGIKGFWNFAHVDLHVPENIQVENVHLSDSLMKLSYNLASHDE